MSFQTFTRGGAEIARSNASRGVRPCPICLDQVARGEVPGFVAELVPCACLTGERWSRNRRGFWSRA